MNLKMLTDQIPISPSCSSNVLSSLLTKSFQVNSMSVVTVFSSKLMHGNDSGNSFTIFYTFCYMDLTLFIWFLIIFLSMGIKAKFLTELVLFIFQKDLILSWHFAFGVVTTLSFNYTTLIKSWIPIVFLKFISWFE